MQPQMTYGYLVQARRRLFDWIRPLTKEQYEREFPYGLGTIHATLLHTAGAEWAYSHRLAGQQVTAADSPYTAEKIRSFAELEAAWSTMAGETHAVLAGISNWDEPVAYRIYPQGPGSPAVRITTTRAGVGAQLILHEAHHRSQVMSMLKQTGVAAQNLDYSVLMFAREQEPA
ncbi:MAG: DinB family protein [bacterium]|nr:DinB family protein [bacterium]